MFFVERAQYKEREYYLVEHTKTRSNKERGTFCTSIRGISIINSLLLALRKHIQHGIYYNPILPLTDGNGGEPFTLSALVGTNKCLQSPLYKRWINLSGSNLVLSNTFRLCCVASDTLWTLTMCVEGYHCFCRILKLHLPLDKISPSFPFFLAPNVKSRATLQHTCDTLGRCPVSREIY